MGAGRWRRGAAHHPHRPPGRPCGDGRRLDGGRVPDEGRRGELGPVERGVSAVFLPDPDPEFGQCVHKVARDAADPDRLYLQNHWGVFRSDNGGDSWSDIGAGLPSDFGFAAVAHPHRGDTAVRLPDQRRRRPGSGGAPLPGLPDERRDAGRTWEPSRWACRAGRTTARCCANALCTDDADPAGIYFGNRNGELYASADDGDSWQQLASELPDVLCVRAVALG
ncbi:Glycosyl hydrolase OS=Streptomyces microflavus OX=1919 GN=Smic_03290 PE=3 SV=1 [Streptomyces microflavus]